MNVDTARTILEAAKEGGYLDEEIPDDEEKLVTDAEFYLTHARAAVEADSADDIIRKIVELGDEAQPTEGYEEPTEKEAGSVPAAITGDNLPIPRQIEGDPPVMPRDISELGDKDVRRLASEFNACLGIVVWRLAQAMDEELGLKQLRDDAFEKAFLEEGRAAEAEERKSTKDDKTVAARQSKEFKKLDKKVHDAEQVVRKYKALKEIYGANIDRLSREATLRDDEFRRRGGK